MPASSKVSDQSTLRCLKLRPLLFVLMFVCGITGPAWAAEGQDAAERAREETSETQGSAYLKDSLWVFENEGRENQLAAEIREQLARGEVKTPDDAKKTASDHRFKHQRRDALEGGGNVMGLIRMARDVPEFAKSGHHIWNVRYFSLGPPWAA